MHHMSKEHGTRILVLREAPAVSVSESEQSSFACGISEFLFS